MIVSHYFEEDLQAHIIIAGKDSAGNELESDLELLINVSENKSPIALHAIESLVALLRGVDDFRVIAKRATSDSMGKWGTNSTVAFPEMSEMDAQERLDRQRINGFRENGKVGRQR